MTPSIKIIAQNKKAFHNYHILESFEAGLCLQGTEVKSVRAGKVNLSDGWVNIDSKGEAYLEQIHIGTYSHGHRDNHEEKRRRKLLLRKKQLEQLVFDTEAKGITLIPIKIYIKDRWIKVQIALAKGKKSYDKRAADKERSDKKEIARAIKA